MEFTRDFHLSGDLTVDEIVKGHPVGKPVLLNHDPNKRIGVITNVEVVTDTRVKVTWKMDESK